MISKRDKDKLLIIAVMIGFVLIVTAFFWGTRFIPLRWIGVAVIVLEFFVIAPRLYERYYRVHGLKADIGKWCPLINEIQLFNPISAKLAYSFIVLLCILIGVVRFVPLTFVGQLFGEHFALNFASYSMGVIVLLIIVIQVVFCSGFCFILREVNNMLSELTGGSSSWMESFYYPLCLFPVVRCLSMAVILEKLGTLIRAHYNDMDKTQRNLFEKGEEI